MDLNQPSPILADGAMGTLLYSSLGLTGQPCFEAINLTLPDAVASIHADYLQAGAELIKTNSFGASRTRLASHGLGDQVHSLNTAAARLARQAVEASGRSAWVAGSIGPLGARLAPYGRLAARHAEGEIAEQVEALCAAGVDALLFETHLDLGELLLALRTARRLTSIPILTSLTFTRDDRTLNGDSPGTAARELHAAGADVIGANCSEGPSQLLRVLEAMHAAAPSARLSVMPNAGWPERAAGRILYPATPEYFAGYAAAYAAAGASIIGGCCGTTPAHIAAMRQALDSAPVRAPLPSPLRTEPAEPGVPTSQPSPFAAKLARGEFVLAVEMDPPRSFSTQKLVAGGTMLAEAGADVLNVADSPMARMRMSPWAVCHVLQQQVGVDTVLHFPTRGRNLLRIQGDLLAAHALGIRNVLVIMGDPTVIGDYPQASGAYDVVPTGLVRIIKHGLNAGVDQAGAAIGDPTSFFAGCALNPFAVDPDREIGVLRRKLEAGADFLLTQPTFEPERLRDFLDRYRRAHGPLRVPVLAGLLPLVSERHAAFMANEVPGVHIPEAVLRRLRGDGEIAQAEGLRLALALAQELRGVVDGLYLMPPFGRYDLVAEIIESVKAAAPGT
jgi:methionine synthase / methylenetetrahydrofolate reductase(NADPH)